MEHVWEEFGKQAHRFNTLRTLTQRAIKMRSVRGLSFYSQPLFRSGRRQSTVEPQWTVPTVHLLAQ
jgi:hypothetical protein